MGYADEYLLNLLNEYKMMEERQQKELKSLPAGKLVIRKEKGKMNFTHYLTEKESGAGKIRRGDYKAAGNDPGASKKAIPAGVSFPPSKKYSGAGISAQKTSGANPG